MLYFFLTVYFGFTLAANAVLLNEVLPNQKLELRARAISSQLRCLVCQNETIDDSNALLAHSLRLFIRERLQEGDNEKQILDFIVARYGEYVLLTPRFSGAKIILWLAPIFILLFGLIYIAFFMIRGRN
ncbi:MAG: cytochrome c-type biogenesis protein CcmH [Candidatus Tokpelaia sp. JSC188]|nr:MAG: cytochrome c-type biogenesis protein CcmH [Candidatus Tokpelaia sp. JSC188]